MSDYSFDELTNDAVGQAIDIGVQATREEGNKIILEGVNQIAQQAGTDLPAVKGTLDTLSGLCNMNLEQTMQGLWELAVDAAVASTGGALVPVAGALKTGGTALIGAAFDAEGASGADQVAAARGG
jgi:hypothetical protein